MAHQAMARRTPDTLRADAAALGLAIGTYVDRLLDAREHPEQGLRAGLGVLRLRRDNQGERPYCLARECSRAIELCLTKSAPVASSRSARIRAPFPSF